MLNGKIERRADAGPHAGHGFGQQGPALVGRSDNGEVHGLLVRLGGEKVADGASSASLLAPLDYHHAAVMPDVGFCRRYFAGK
ncbi:MAG: hypothetical protein NVS3B25_21990 [Hymenobacter sp.]